jgi:hypothetical protein
MSGNSIITRGFGEFDLIPSRGYGLCQFNFLDYTPEIIDVRYAYLNKPSVSVQDIYTKPNIKINKALTKPKSLRGKYRRKNYYVDSY